MSLNLRSMLVQCTALALACSASFACGNSEDNASQTGAAEARDAEVVEAGKGDAAAGKGGSGVSGDQSVTIRFRAAVADRDFSCLERYENVGSSKTTAVPADFRFYVQDLKLIASDGEEVPVALEVREPWQTRDVALLDFEDMQGRCHGTPETNVTITGRAPAGEYRGVVFTNGVPEALNHLDPAEQPAPLDVTDLHWAWLTGYRFMVAELMQDRAAAAGATDEDAGVAQPGIGLMHIGSTSCRKDKGCTKQNRSVVRLEEFDPNSNVIVADIAAIFSASDLSEEMQCHAADEVCGPMFERLGVDLATGESLNRQQVFRVAAGNGVGAGR